MKANRFRKSYYAALTAVLSLAAAQNAPAAAISIADSPLYLGVPVDPNVFFMIDDSGSMDWEILTGGYWYYASYWNSTEGNRVFVENGRWRTYANAGDCTGRDNYSYLFDNADVLYSNCSLGAIVENSPESVTRDWRVRSSHFNVLYYDPAVTYAPWPGYANASFTSVRSNPHTGQPGYDDLKDLTGFAYEVWTDSHGFSGDHPAGPNSATNTPNGKVDLWDNHVRYTIGSSIIRQSFTHDPATVSSGTTCSYSDATDSPPFRNCFNTAASTATVAVDAQGRTLAEVKQNIANWYQYHRKRSFVTKASVAEVITAKPTFRYGLSVINDRDELFTEMPAPAVSDYESHNSSLINSFFAYTWDANGTPLRRGLEYAGRYYDGVIEGAPSPILPEDKGGACQKNFTVLFTDGYWNGGDPEVVETDKDGDGSSVTVADVAKHYYDKDLSDLDDLVVGDAFDPATHQHMVTFSVAFGVQGTLVDLDGDGWPNPALTESDDWGDPTGCSDCAQKIDDLWHAAYNSRGTFVSASTPEQVAASLEAALASVEERTEVSASSVALNSGSISSDALLYQARFNSENWTGELLAFRIVSDTSSPSYGQLDVSGSGPDGSQWDAGLELNTQNWDTGRTILTYKPSNAKGIAFRWPSNPASPTATELDVAQVAALNANPATGSADGEGEARLRFLRGDRSCEIGGTGSCSFDLDNDGTVESSADKLYRQRGRVLGDTINSAPALVGAPKFPYPDNWGSGAPENAAAYSSFKSTYGSRTPIVYIGANDGMLHGFQADDSGAFDAGTELLAYVPSTVYDNLGALTQDDYTHLFYVDGSPTAGDVFFSSAWHTVVVGGLNKGGQGIYALDVTNPSAFGETSTSADATVLWEFTDADDADVGYTFSQPALVRMKNGKWAAVFGNGYNNTESDGNVSSDGHAKLFIVFIEGGTDGSWDSGDYIKIDTGAGTTSTPNGLATVAPVDVDGDYIVDYVYAGDLEGNMWKFDVNSTNTARWGVDYKLYQACSEDPCVTPQPITTRPEVGSAPNGKDLMVYFGTGKYLGSSDPSNTNMQTFYGVIDDGSAVAGRSALLQQTIDVQKEQTFDDGTTYELRVSSDNALETTHDGWYMDLIDPAGAEPGERVVSSPLLRSGRIIFTTIIPNSNACSAGGSSWLMEIDARDGSRLSYSPFDLNNDRAFSLDDYVWIPADVDGDGTIADDEGYWAPASAKRSAEGMIAGPGVLVGEGEEVKYTPGTTGGVEVTRENPGPAGLKRQSWRQVR